MLYDDYLNIPMKNNLFDFSKKDSSVRLHIAYMLCRSRNMFKWKNLPDTIPEIIFEIMIQSHGHCVVTDVDGSLYAFNANLGGKPDAYYLPTLAVVANPGLNFNKSLEIGKDCVLVQNDSLFLGTLPIYLKYGTALAENELTMRVEDINIRIMNLISAGDVRVAESAKKYLKDIEDGKLGVVSDAKFNSEENGIKVQSSRQSSSNILTSLIEYEQYLRACEFNDIGLNANYNMKRESINSDEAQLNEDSLLPFIDDMLLCRRLAAKKINEMFGTDISVDLDSSWEDKQLEIELAHQYLDEKSKDDVDTEVYEDESTSGIVDYSIDEDVSSEDESESKEGESEDG